LLTMRIDAYHDLVISRDHCYDDCMAVPRAEKRKERQPLSHPHCPDYNIFKCDAVFFLKDLPKEATMSDQSPRV